MNNGTSSGGCCSVFGCFLIVLAALLLPLLPYLLPAVLIVYAALAVGKAIGQAMDEIESNREK